MLSVETLGSSGPISTGNVPGLVSEKMHYVSPFGHKSFGRPLAPYGRYSERLTPPTRGFRIFSRPEWLSWLSNSLAIALIAC